MTLLERITAKGFTLTAVGCPPMLHVEPAGQLTATQRRTIEAHGDDLLEDVLYAMRVDSAFPFVDPTASLALARAMGDARLGGRL